MICAGVFAIVGTVVGWFLKRPFNPMTAITQAGSGASFPTFIMMPFVPFDADLMNALAQSWVSVGMAGLIGVGVTIYSLWHQPKNGN